MRHINGGIKMSETQNQPVIPTPEPENAANPAENTAAGAAAAAPAEDMPSAAPAQKFQNAGARIMMRVHIALLVFTVLFIALQLYFMVMTGIQQGFMLSLLYNLPSIMLFLLMFVGVSYLFRFFAELLELLSKK